MTPLALAVLLAVGQAEAKPQVETSPNPTQYQPVTLTFTGPEASETGEVNPFRDYRLEVTFRLKIAPLQKHPRLFRGGRPIGGDWRNKRKQMASSVHTTKGWLWSWHASFRRGKDAALQNGEVGSALSFDGTSGVFLAGRAVAGQTGFGASGTLIQGYHGGLGFEGSGHWFLKAVPIAQRTCSPMRTSTARKHSAGLSRNATANRAGKGCTPMRRTFAIGRKAIRHGATAKAKGSSVR